MRILLFCLVLLAVNWVLIRSDVLGSLPPILFAVIAVWTGDHRRRAHHKNMRAIDAAFVLEELRQRSPRVEPVLGGD